MLERRIADFLDMAEAVLFPTGWAAAYGAIKGLVRPADHVVMDTLSHPSLKEGAAASTKNIYLFRHNSVEDCRRRSARYPQVSTATDAATRTASFRRANADALIEQDQGRPLTSQVAALPGVMSVQAMTFTFAGIPEEDAGQRVGVEIQLVDA